VHLLASQVMVGGAVAPYRQRRDLYEGCWVTGSSTAMAHSKHKGKNKWLKGLSAFSYLTFH
jgi:hypothetical protein